MVEASVTVSPYRGWVCGGGKCNCHHTEDGSMLEVNLTVTIQSWVCGGGKCNCLHTEDGSMVEVSVTITIQRMGLWWR